MALIKNIKAFRILNLLGMREGGREGREMHYVRKKLSGLFCFVFPVCQHKKRAAEKNEGQLSFGDGSKELWERSIARVMGQSVTSVLTMTRVYWLTSSAEKKLLHLDLQVLSFS